MPDMPKLREIISTFTPEELELSVPIDIQDVNATDYPMVNDYNQLLAEQKYQEAYNFRTENPEIEKYILDAKKINMLITYIMNAYEFAKAEKNATNTSYDDSISKLGAKNVQTAIDNLETKVDELETEIPRKVQDIGIGAITAYGSAGLLKIDKNVIKEVPLTRVVAVSDPDPYYIIEENGIGIYEPGLYLISASAYMKTDKAEGRVSKGVFVIDENGTEILSTTENTYTNSDETFGATSTAAKLINVTWDDMDIPNDRYRLNLHVRINGTTGHVDTENSSTFLTIVRVGGNR